MKHDRENLAQQYPPGAPSASRERDAWKGWRRHARRDLQRRDEVGRDERSEGRKVEKEKF
jgi:hypothetical protein